MNDKVRAVIIDNEETAIDNLCFELKKYPWISVEGIAYNGKALKKNVRICYFWM